MNIPNRSFFKRLKRGNVSQDEADGNTSYRPVSSHVLNGEEASAKNHPLLKQFLCVINQQRLLLWLTVTAGFIWCCAIIIFGGTYALNSRPIQMGTALNTLEETINAEIEEIVISRDRFDLFAISTLKILFNLDDSGASYRALLKGSVNPTILGRFNAEMLNSIADIRKNMMVQNLTINTIREFAYNAETGIASAYVMGYITTVLQQSPTGTRAGTTPFRAKIFVKNGLKSSLSPFGFYLEEMDDRLGGDAIEWDKEVLQ